MACYILIKINLVERYSWTHIRQQTNQQRIFFRFCYTARFRFERLLFLGREGSGICLFLLEA